MSRNGNKRAKSERVSANDPARGARLSAAMAARRLHYNCQLCYDLGVTESSLSRWRSGGPISVEMAVRLAKILDVTVDWLITGRTAAGTQGDIFFDGDSAEATGLFAALLPGTRQVILELLGVLMRQGGTMEAMASE